MSCEYIPCRCNMGYTDQYYDNIGIGQIVRDAEADTTEAPDEVAEFVDGR